MTVKYVKTAAGREAIQLRAQALSRAARTLLLIIDPRKTGIEWVSAVAGATEADLAKLIEAGFIESAARAAAQARGHEAALLEVLEGRGYDELQELLTEQARVRLGLIKGYRMVLEIEKCLSVEDLRKLAMRFVEEVRAVQGEALAQAFCKDLSEKVG